MNRNEIMVARIGRSGVYANPARGTLRLGTRGLALPAGCFLRAWGKPVRRKVRKALAGNPDTRRMAGLPTDTFHGGEPAA